MDNIKQDITIYKEWFGLSEMIENDKIRN